MKPFEQAVEAASAAEEIPGVVLLATDKSGKFKYGKAFGKRSVRAGADQSPLQLDTVMWIASCTKVVTALAALQCCERGLLTLDGPIYDVLPEFRGLPIIKRFNKDGSPVLEPHSKPITLRHMLNHSSGIAYDETHPKLLKWHQWHRTAPNRCNAVEGRYGYPLVFEPGDSWCYGAGVDWAGVAVERVNGGISLQRYFEENIFSKVGARDIVFSSHLYTRPDLRARVADMSKRDPANPAKVIRSNARAQYNERGGCFGGLGLFATPTDYLKIIKGILTTDEDQRLLSTKGVDEFFRPCLSEKAKAALNRLVAVEEARIGMGNIPATVTKNWALGGIVNEGDVPGGRRAGSMTWTGLPNLAWFVDRTSSLCGLYAGQLYPPGDAKVGELQGLFEQGIYEMHSKVSPKL
ncbi:beta-lactamase/transpeptidase-like protein [Xylaria bambusicola]|uniref:beta-lactamase/transpeptidase-like protein n=1 Tax=Xylaria bambusicola TaxID=326684 RepID=UPI00200757BB|nr:beta-lactamase/transpeptidase-like protein [Xylaria bambusicola]KAI0508484.1 beta-lactamase/transpeptidase-like protein [Xylaria bambusicola]